MTLNLWFMSGNETLGGLAVDAAKGALQMAHVEAEEVDLVIMCTSTPDDLFGCGAQNILVVGGDVLSRYVDWTDRGTCILFGDAAGAVRYRPGSGRSAYRLAGGLVHTAWTLADTLKNSKGPVKILLYTTIKEARSKMNGKEVFRFAVRCVPHSIEAALEEAGLTSSNIDWLLLHQVISNLANYGNTSAASIPLALDEAVRTGKVQAGNTIATAGFGAGLTWGSVIMRWK
ncbi:hypothetical protein GW17_00002980 [Ensete ventricosum]|nr:hypothetical protein GW17_00002980 [Ensete ventricosum]RZS04455.1 hypothetical protein BHM03_00034794 [Ensete ventricosum]